MKAKPQPIKKKTNKQLRPLNVLISILLTLGAIVVLRRKNFRGVAGMVIILVLHNVFPDGYVHAVNGFLAALTVCLTVIFYTTQAVLSLLGVHPQTIKKHSHE